MQFPESWLRAFCNPPLTTQQLADLLTMSGMEVEDLRPVAPPFTGVVVAEILTAEQHPQADRLRVCTVDAGAFSKDGPLQIVCGAPNARVGIRVPLALVGAELPPAEEGGAGALKMIEDGLFSRFPTPVVVLGQHVAPLPAGPQPKVTPPLGSSAMNLPISMPRYERVTYDTTNELAASLPVAEPPPAKPPSSGPARPRPKVKVSAPTLPNSDPGL